LFVLNLPAKRLSILLGFKLGAAYSALRVVVPSQERRFDVTGGGHKIQRLIVIISIAIVPESIPPTIRPTSLLSPTNPLTPNTCTLAPKMVLEYFTSKKGKQAAQPEASTATAAEVKSPVLKAEDEAFLERLASEIENPPESTLPVVLYQGEGKDAQAALMDGADKVPLPQSPPAEEPKSKRNYWAYLQQKVPPLPFGPTATKRQAGSNLDDVAKAVKSGESLAPPVTVVSAEEAEKEKQDLSSILDQLNLSAINNRAFSFSKESQKLMDDFTQVLKDLVNGVPTAYDDLEKLLTNRDKQLRGMFDNLPPFLQKLVKSLPAKMTGSLAPGLLAAASEKPGADGQMLGEPSSGKSKRSYRVPPLKKLVSEQGAVSGLLKSIFNFLKLRFPAAVTGTNVLLSLAVFCK
jgi:hypothetical protein